MSLLLAQLSAGGTIQDGAAAIASVSAWAAAAGAVRPGAAVLASVSTWSASGEAVGSGAVKEGAADLAIASVWTASAAKAQTVTSGGGGGYFPKKRRKPPIQFPKRISIKTATAAVCRSAMEWGASAVAIRSVTAQVRNTSRMTSRSSRRAAGAGVVRNRSLVTGRGVPIRGIGMTETEAALIFSLIE
jgi:hypothetical protein